MIKPDCKCQPVMSQGEMNIWCVMAFIGFDTLDWTLPSSKPDSFNACTKSEFLSRILIPHPAAASLITATCDFIPVCCACHQEAPQQTSHRHLPAWTTW